MPLPAIKPWFGVHSAQDLWIDGLSQNVGPFVPSCGKCFRALHMDDRVAKVFTIKGETRSADNERGEYLGTVCKQCRDRADDRKASILGIFDKLSGDHVTVSVSGTSDDSTAELAKRVCRALRSV